VNPRKPGAAVASRLRRDPESCFERTSWSRGNRLDILKQPLAITPPGSVFMSLQTLASQNLQAIWERVLLPDRTQISPEQARYFLRLKFPNSNVRRMRALSAKGKRGTLTCEEDEALENYIRVGHLLGILQSRARQVLRTDRGVS